MTPLAVSKTLTTDSLPSAAPTRTALTPLAVKASTTRTSCSSVAAFAHARRSMRWKFEASPRASAALIVVPREAGDASTSFEIISAALSPRSFNIGAGSWSISRRKEGVLPSLARTNNRRKVSCRFLNLRAARSRSLRNEFTASVIELSAFLTSLGPSQWSSRRLKRFWLGKKWRLRIVPSSSSGWRQPPPP